MLKSLSIDNFRGIKHLEIGNFSRVNIFVGGNGSGKTTVLEALAVLASPGDPHMLSKLAMWRDMGPMNSQIDYPLRSFFFELNAGREITLSAVTDAGTQRLAVTGLQVNISQPNGAESSLAMSGVISQGVNGPVSSSGRIEESSGADVSNLAGVSYQFVDEIGETATATASLIPMGLQGMVRTVRRGLGVFYIQGRRANSVAETAEAITRITESGDEEEFLRIIRAIEPRCRSVQVGLLGGQPILFADVGKMKRLSISLLGDGFCRACLIATGLVAAAPKITIVDDIDAGLHHTVMENFWRAILRICHRRDMQLFCSSHSDEMLRAAVTALTESPDDLKLFRIDKSQDGHVSAENYDFIHAQTASNNGIEVR